VMREKEAFWRVRQAITRYRILLEAYRAELPGRAGKGAGPGVWRTLAQLDGLALTSAHRKLLAVLRDERKLEKVQKAVKIQVDVRRQTTADESGRPPRQPQGGCAHV